MPFEAVLGMRASTVLFVSLAIPAVAWGQAFNLDFGEPGHAPGPEYGAAGLPGVWNAFPAEDGSTSRGLVDVDGLATDVTVRQLGGSATPLTDDPATAGDDGLLLDDHLVTFNAALESCLFFENLDPGAYEVLIYAWMPEEPDVKSYTGVDQEPENPHHEVGGPWTGEHLLLGTYARHLAEVGEDGILNMHSGIVPGADARSGAALNGVQIRPWGQLFADGFESGDTTAWSATVE